MFMNTNIQDHTSHYNPVYTPPPMYAHSILIILTQICISLPTHLPSCGFLPNLHSYCCTYTSSQSQSLPLIPINDTVWREINEAFHETYLKSNYIEKQEANSYLFLWLNIQYFCCDSFGHSFLPSFLGYSHIWIENPPPKCIKKNANHWNTVFSEIYMTHRLRRYRMGW